MQPIYIKTYRDGKFPEKIRALKGFLSSCTLCPRLCKVDRTKGERGFCEAGAQARIAAAYPHFGEEACLVGKNGSGTVFFSYCSLKCLFCQNYEISHQAEGNDLNAEALATTMLSLQGMGCHNLNLVTPTHYVPQIVEALNLAVKEGLHIPIVYNCGGYESAEVIEILDGIVDIYMPDAKFSSAEAGQKLCFVPDYFQVLKKVLKEMHRQVGDLQIIDGMAVRGLLVRYLVMPEDYPGTKEIMGFIADEISPDTYVNIMDQYRPCGQSFRMPRINRMITPQEYRDAVATARACGLTRLDKES